MVILAIYVSIFSFHSVILSFCFKSFVSYPIVFFFVIKHIWCARFLCNNPDSIWLFHHLGLMLFRERPLQTGIHNLMATFKLLHNFAHDSFSSVSSPTTLQCASAKIVFNFSKLPLCYIQICSSLTCLLYTWRFILKETNLWSLMPNSGPILTLFDKPLFVENIRSSIL